MPTPASTKWSARRRGQRDPFIRSAGQAGYDVVAYPARGQGPDQQSRDRYECHRWAVVESGFDPAGATYAPAAEVANGYRRAMAACLSGRGYSVN